MSQDKLIEEPGPPSPPDSILETSLYCEDLEQARHFYGDVVGLEEVSWLEGWHVFFRCGPGMLLIFNAENSERLPERNGRIEPLPPHGTRGAGHVALSIDASQVHAWKTRLSERGIPIEQEIDWPEGGYSLFVRDPAGNSIEFATPELWFRGRDREELNPAMPDEKQ